MRRKTKKKRRSIGSVILRWLLVIALLIIVVSGTAVLVSTRTRVVDDSMSPVLKEGDLLSVDRITYKFFNPSRYDVVIFPSAYQENTFFIRRIIGLPGETVRIVDGDIYINGNKIKDPYGQGVTNPGIAVDNITVGANEYFVLSDNRSAKDDSRDAAVGNISSDSIVGHAWLRLWPIERFGLIR